MKLAVFALLLLFENTSAHSTGANPLACTNLTPSHGPNQPQGSTPPLTISLDTHTVRRGGFIKVTISTPFEFRGYLIQARPFNQVQAIGTYSVDSEVRTLDCLGGFENTATHTSSALRFTQTVSWNAPTDFTGSFRFHVSFVQSFTTFWVNVQSASVEVIN